MSVPRVGVARVLSAEQSRVRQTCCRTRRVLLNESFSGLLFALIQVQICRVLDAYCRTLKPATEDDCMAARAQDVRYSFYSKQRNDSEFNSKNEVKVQERNFE